MPITLFGTSGSDILDGRAYNTSLTVYGYGSRDFIYGSDWGDFIDAGSGYDVIFSGDGDDTIFAGADSDTIYLTGGDDYINGWSGSDTIDFSRATAGVRVDFSEGTAEAYNDIYASRIGQKTFTSVEVAVGTRWADDFIGSSGDESVYGYGGNDRFRLGAGDDKASGGDGDDYFYVDAGDDKYYGGDGYDRLDLLNYTHGVEVNTGAGWLKSRSFVPEGQDVGFDRFEGFESLLLTRGDDIVDATGDTADRIYGWHGNDTVKIGEGDFADGAMGEDTLDLSGIDTDRIYVGSQQAMSDGEVVATWSRFERIDGGNAEERFYVDNVSGAYIDGNGGRDHFSIEANASGVFAGGYQNDTFVVQIGSGQTFHGGDGHDTLKFWEYEKGISYDAASGAISHMASDFRAANAWFFDRVEGTSFSDQLSGGTRDETLLGRDGSDFLKGEGGSDKLFGGRAGDVLDGGTGNDWLHGEAGDDLLTGQTGSDSFVFSQGEIMRDGRWTYEYVGDDQITDFDAMEGDVIVFDAHPGSVLRLQDGTDLRAFTDLDTNGDGLVTARDTNVARTAEGMVIDLYQGSISVDGMQELYFDSFVFA